MTKNLIIKSSYSKIPDGTLKSNFGDLIRIPILLEDIGDDFLWITDERSVNLLKYFVNPKKIVTFKDNKLSRGLSVSNIYNLDNYVFNKKLFDNLEGDWHGYGYKEGEVYPKNSLISSIAPYTFQKTDKSWQQTLVEGLGFSWKEQDFTLAKIQKKESIDVGLNWNVHPKWTSKHWPKENWEELEQILKKNYSVSWQRGLNDFDVYINWMSSCRLIVTCETLGKHLASGLRKKVVAIVGSAESNEFSYSRITSLKPSLRNCMPCNSPECKFGKGCLNEISPRKVADTVLNVLGG